MCNLWALKSFFEKSNYTRGALLMPLVCVASVQSLYSLVWKSWTQKKTPSHKRWHKVRLYGLAWIYLVPWIHSLLALGPLHSFDSLVVSIGLFCPIYAGWRHGEKGGSYSATGSMPRMCSAESVEFQSFWVDQRWCKISSKCFCYCVYQRRGWGGGCQ